MRVAIDTFTSSVNPTVEGCGLSLNASRHTSSNVSSRTKCSRLGLISVSEPCVSGLGPFRLVETLCRRNHYTLCFWAAISIRIPRYACYFFNINLWQMALANAVYFVRLINQSKHICMSEPTRGFCTNKLIWYTAVHLCYLLIFGDWMDILFNQVTANPLHIYFYSLLSYWLQMATSGLHVCMTGSASQCCKPSLFHVSKCDWKKTKTRWQFSAGRRKYYLWHWRIFVVLNSFHCMSQPRSQKLQRLSLVSDKTQRFCFLSVSELRLGSRLGLGLDGLVHIPATVIHIPAEIHANYCDNTHDSGLTNTQILSVSIGTHLYRTTCHKGTRGA